MSILAVCLGQRRPLEREPCRDRLAGRGGWTPTVSVASLSVIGGCSGASRRLLQCARPSSLLVPAHECRACSINPALSNAIHAAGQLAQSNEGLCRSAGSRTARPGPLPRRRCRWGGCTRQFCSLTFCYCERRRPGHSLRAHGARSVTLWSRHVTGHCLLLPLQQQQPRPPMIATRPGPRWQSPRMQTARSALPCRRQRYSAACS